MAHAVGAGDGPFRAFWIGVLEVFASPPVVVAILASALMATIWRADALLRLWPALAAGTLAGAVVAFAEVANPLAVALCGATLLGLLGSAGSPLSAGAMRVVAVAAGVVLSVSALGWHSWSMAPATSYAGTLVALNGGFALAAGLLGAAKAAVRKAWFDIALRAVASWLVAVTLMMAALYWKDGLFAV
ncbi:MAG: hypothetical protein H6891_07860 [Brucellaceae bacterium]|nr:hypothetical protein [Brucellaceae bacterium]